VSVFFILLFFRWLWASSEENETFFSVYALSFAQFLGLSTFASSKVGNNVSTVLFELRSKIGGAIFDLLLQTRCMMADGGCMMYHENTTSIIEAMKTQNNKYV